MDEEEQEWIPKRRWRDTWRHRQGGGVSRSPGTSDEHLRDARGTKKFIHILLYTAVVSFLVAFIVQIFVIQLYKVPTPSMSDTLKVGEYIAVLKTDTHPERGDIITFEDPGGWVTSDIPPSLLDTALKTFRMSPRSPDAVVVKRVVGMPGDTVECCSVEGSLMINGVPYPEPYLTTPTDQIQFSVVVPADSFFVLGDNRANSADSRYHLEQNNGAVPSEKVTGTVKFGFPFG